jgi:hypothetical protein
MAAMKRQSSARDLLGRIVKGKVTGTELTQRPVLAEWFTTAQIDYLLCVVLLDDRLPHQQQIYTQVVQCIRNSKDQSLWDLMSDRQPEEEIYFTPAQTNAGEILEQLLAELTTEKSLQLANSIFETIEQCTAKKTTI